MGDLYIITGPAGIGKSTISKAIATKSEKSALIEGDEIYHLVCGGYISAWQPDNHLEIFWQNCTDIIKNFLDAGYDVVFNYIINQSNLQKLKETLLNNLENSLQEISIKFIVLLSDEATLASRDKQRLEDFQMKERSLILLEEMKNQNFNPNNILETSNLTVEETVEIILTEDRFLLK